MSFMVKRLGGGGNERHPIEEMKELVKENAVKIILAITAASAIGTLFVAGISISLFELTAQYYAGERFRMSPFLFIGGTFMFVTVLFFIIGLVFATRHDREKKRVEREMKQKHIHTIQDAILLLVNDYIAEREFKRNQAQTMTAQQGPMTSQYKSSEEFERH
jgi:NADH:ubiquinone oxidoreductase subunit 5 (subunit L)/multisubunit Na+/H+ antiporter MnhA subunit